MYGKEASEEFELKSCEPPHKFMVYVDGSKGSSKKGEYFFDHTLSPENGGTRFEIQAVIDGMGWMGFFISPIVRGFFRKAMHRDLLALKNHIERLID
jgi:carbon monoxide dehydrogenase subunit G